MSRGAAATLLIGSKYGEGGGMWQFYGITYTYVVLTME